MRQDIRSVSVAPAIARRAVSPGRWARSPRGAERRGGRADRARDAGNRSIRLPVDR